jgi:CRP/FNR family transcriptional regulator, cyclic AMP receptor protein
MQAGQTEQTHYRVWGIDNIVYGPVNGTVLADWVLSQRLTPGSWVYSDRDGAWVRASERPELKDLLRPAGMLKPSAKPLESAIELLRGLDLFEGLTDQQIASFAHYSDIVEVGQFTRFVQKGDPGDAMFIVLDGEVRAYLIVDGRECTLSTLGPGEFVGEISLLDQGPRSADMAANVDTTLLRLSTNQFQGLSREAPALAAPFLLALSRTVVRRVRSTTQRYEDSIHYMGRKIPGWAERA